MRVATEGRGLGNGESREVWGNTAKDGDGYEFKGWLRTESHEEWYGLPIIYRYLRGLAAGRVQKLRCRKNGGAIDR